MPQSFPFQILSHIGKGGFYCSLPVPWGHSLIGKSLNLSHGKISSDSIVAEHLGQFFNLVVFYRGVDSPSFSSFKDRKCLL